VWWLRKYRDPESDETTNGEQNSGSRASRRQACRGQYLADSDRVQAEGHDPPVRSRVTGQHTDRLLDRVVIAVLDEASNNPARDKRDRRQSRGHQSPRHHRNATRVRSGTRHKTQQRSFDCAFTRYAQREQCSQRPELDASGPAGVSAPISLVRCDGLRT
jgi:hypothetical protein